MSIREKNRGTIQGMGRIKSKNTSPELLVRKYLFSKGLRYRLYINHLPGKPDMVLKKFKAIVFINGCFWHAHDGCRYKKIPKKNAGFWEDKIGKNVIRDKNNINMLQGMGWRVYIVWECDLKKGTIIRTLDKLIEDIKAELN